MLLADPVETLQPVHFRHAEVEQCQIRVRLGDEGEDLAADPGLGDDLELVVLLKGTLDSGENERVVVCDQNAHGQSLVISSVGSSPRLGGPR